MVGYIKNKTQVLNKLYQLFRQNNPNSFVKKNKHWENITKFNEKQDFFKNYFFKECSKYNFIYNDNKSNINISDCKVLSLPIDCYKLIFINGKLSSTFSDIKIDPWILKINHDNVHLNIFNPIYPTIFLYLIEYLSDTIVHIKLPDNIITKKPLYLLHINSGSNIVNQLTTSYSYHYLEIGQNTNACVIEHFLNINEYGCLNGDRMLISVGNRSELDHIKLVFDNKSSYRISCQDIHINQYSHIRSNIFTILGPKLSYHQVNSKINHERSSLSLNSLSILSQTDINNIKTYLEHSNHDYSISRQLHKIIAKDNSTGIFNGTIKVNENTVHADSKMVNNNLLLDKSVSIYSTPKLEIYSDSVQCNHGTTFGYINTNHIFFLNTRGITKQDAIDILIYAFSEEIIQTIQYSPLKKIIVNRINHFFNKNIIDYDDLPYTKN